MVGKQVLFVNELFIAPHISTKILTSKRETFLVVSFSAVPLSTACSFLLRRPTLNCSQFPSAPSDPLTACIFLQRRPTLNCL